MGIHDKIILEAFWSIFMENKFKVGDTVRVCRDSKGGWIYWSSAMRDVIDKTFIIKEIHSRYTNTYGIDIDNNNVIYWFYKDDLEFAGINNITKRIIRKVYNI